jgi:hypothetical protein
MFEIILMTKHILTDITGVNDFTSAELTTQITTNVRVQFMAFTFLQSCITLTYFSSKQLYFNSQSFTCAENLEKGKDKSNWMC